MTDSLVLFMGHGEDSAGITGVIIIVGRNDGRRIRISVFVYIERATRVVLHTLRSACRKLKISVSAVNTDKIFLHKDTAFLPQTARKGTINEFNNQKIVLI